MSETFHQFVTGGRNKPYCKCGKFLSMLKNNKKCKAFFVFQKSSIFENHLNLFSYATSMPPTEINIS